MSRPTTHPARPPARSAPGDVDPGDVDPGDALEAAARRTPAADEEVIRLAAELNRSPADVADQVAVHFHQTPERWLEDLRCRWARDALRDGATPERAAATAGFASLPDLNARFQRRYRITPEAFARLDAAHRFEIDLPSWLARGPLLAYLGRDPRGASEAVDGNRFRVAFSVDARVVGMMVDLGTHRAEVSLAGPRGVPADAAFQAHELTLRLLGAHLDPRPFERATADDPRLRAVVAAQRGLAISQTRNLFDALLWVVAGQQVSLPVAFALRRRLTRHVGQRLDDRLVAPPAPAAVADMDTSELRGLGFSVRKAEYLLAMARAVVNGTFNESSTGRSAVEVATTLAAVRGLGPWSVGYLLMRAFSFADCVPVGDAALVRKLARVFNLDARPGPAETLALMAPFVPYRSLATFYLWAMPEP